MVDVDVAVDGLTAGFETPLALLALPAVAVALWYLLFRRQANDMMGAKGRLLLFGSRFLVVTFLVVAAAGPYTVTATETPGDPEVRLLVDRSDSMALYDTPVDELTQGIEAEGVPVTTTVVGSDTHSRIGDGVIASLEQNGTVVLVSDGRVTEGHTLQEAAELARSLDATVSAVNLSSETTERYVTIAGPAKTSVGVDAAFMARIDGYDVEDDATVSVTVDGEQVREATVTGDGDVRFNHTFASPGVHRVTATVAGEDRFDVNDVARKTVRVVERPRVLYVADREYPLARLLDDLYNVTVRQSVPADLSPYYSVVLQDMPADGVGNVSALQRYVVNGNGLVVAGGENAYEAGGYGESALGAMLPVHVGEGGREGTAVVLLVDVSGSTSEGMRVQKAVALDALNQLDDAHRVGLVAFADAAYRIADLRPLGESRSRLENDIRRLQSGGGTDIAAGLRGANQLLGESGGNVILISDGIGDDAPTLAAARELAGDDVRVITVGVGGRIDEPLLRQVAGATDGTYVRADETSRLRLLFGDGSRTSGGSGLTVVTSDHFITAGVQPQSNPSETNDVSTKEGADFLVAAGDGRPAFSAWRYGLGRVVSVTAYGTDGSLDGLLARPDSVLLSRSVNWAIGDPERKSTGVVDAPDTRVGEPTTITYVGESRPMAEGATFRQVADGRYEATVVPAEPGFSSVLGAEFAANYPEEYAGFGLSPELRESVAATDGQVFEPGDAAAIAALARQQSTRVRDVRTSWGWVFLAAALLVFLGEVGARRVVAPTGVIS